MDTSEPEFTSAYTGWRVPNLSATSTRTVASKTAARLSLTNMQRRCRCASDSGAVRPHIVYRAVMPFPASAAVDFGLTFRECVPAEAIQTQFVRDGKVLPRPQILSLELFTEKDPVPCDTVNNSACGFPQVLLLAPRCARCDRAGLLAD